MTTAWTGDHLRRIEAAAVSRLPVYAPTDYARPLPELYYWDMWAVQGRDGRIADVAGRELWMALTAPDRGDPSRRHFEAKIRLLERRGDRWADLGPVLPDGDVPYQREWAGSAVWDGGRLELYFTGAGLADKPGGYQQALYEAFAASSPDGLPVGWTRPRRILADPGPDYMPADDHEGEAGKIKAYRDPAYFRDPVDGSEYLAFTASLAGGRHEYNGAFGLARKVDGEWRLLPPPIHALGTNNELERAHIVFHDSRYYAFWVTQRSTFAPGVDAGPNGLYGMVSEDIAGPYRPLNGSALVLANPVAEPHQAYSWFVTGELLVSSFVDFAGLGCAAPPGDPGLQNAHFVGAPAPLAKLWIDGDTCRLAGEA